jgi:hypothetical protein
MKQTMQLLCCVLVLLSTCFLGCSNVPKDFRHSDFLDDYSGFAPLNKFRGAYGYAKENLDLTDYDKIIIEPVAMHFANSPSGENLTAAQADRLNAMFHQSLVREISKSLSVTTGPGTNTLRLRTALTGLVSNSALAMKTRPGYAPKAGLAQVGETPDFYVQVSGVAMEMELLNSVTGERLAAVVDRKGQDVSSEAEKWQVTEKVFNYWASRVGEIMADLRQ